MTNLESARRMSRRAEAALAGGSRPEPDPEWHTEDGYRVVRPRQICDGDGGSTWGCFSPTPLEIGDVAINRTRDGSEWPVEITDEAEEYEPAPWKPRAGRGFFYWTVSLDGGPERERPRRRRRRPRW